MRDLILALDQGTTSTRAILYDADIRPLTQASRSLRQSYPRPGWVEHDPEAIFADSVAVMSEALARAGRSAAEVAALGVTNQRETVLVWERATGRPIHPAVVWQDRRTSEACERLRARGAEAEVVAVTGLLLDPYFSATKIVWLLDHVEGARAAAERGELLAGTVDAWLVWRLTGGGVHATDSTNASRTSLMDLERQAWSPEMAALFGVPLRLMPEIRDTAGDFGETAADLLGAPLPIRAVVGDQQASLAGHGCNGAGGLKATYGTGAFMLLNTGPRAPRSAHRLLTTVAAKLAGSASYALEGSIFSAGAAVQWVEGLGVTGGPEAVGALAARAARDSGVVLVPAFTGLGAPHWDARARGGLFGLTRDSGPAEIAAAAFDAAAFQTRDLIEAMAADAPEAFAASAPLRIDGGMARSRFFAQRLADLTGLQVLRAEDAEATARGAALLARAGLDGRPESSLVAPPTEGFAPALDPAARDAAHARWRSAVAAARGFVAAFEPPAT